MSSASDNATPSERCDLIMKGGITSGVVYPAALIRLASRYRFACIGGTSAGAIAAGIAAAAEHGREQGAFAKLATLPTELAGILLPLFQPAGPFRRVFRAIVSASKRRSKLAKVLVGVGSLLISYWTGLLVALFVALVYPWSEQWTLLGTVRNVLGGVTVILAVALTVVAVVTASLVKNLPRYFFGVCPGLQQRKRKSRPALTQWLTGYLDSLAGARPSASAHLTFGDLKAAGVTLQMMTTDLSMQRPYRLPMTPTAKGSRPEYAFRESEFRQLFPKSVVDQMATAERAVPDNAGLYWLPEADDLPVVVAVRMSLSFPILLSAIPLWRKDRTFRAEPAEMEKYRRCIFSDGGITSNFPIHFFDRPLPRRPTFAISLDRYDPRRHGPDQPRSRENRVYMPEKAGSGMQLPVHEIDTVLPFVAAVFNSARNWQDALQSVLAGYRERIAHVALDDEEGGLNLAMPRERIEALRDYGNLAGERMLQFDFDEHRWRRFLVAYARIEETLEELHEVYAGGFDQFLRTYPDRPPESYKPVSGTWMDRVRERMAELDELAASWDGESLREHGRIPKPDCELRITPRA
jgi:predicted acylesterase/phospholipase RssA